MISFCFRCGTLGPVVYVDLGDLRFEFLCATCASLQPPRDEGKREGGDG